MRAQHHGGSLAATRASHAAEGGYYSGWKQKEGRGDGGAVGDNEARDGDEGAHYRRGVYGMVYSSPAVQDDPPAALRMPWWLSTCR